MRKGDFDKLAWHLDEPPEVRAIYENHSGIARRSPENRGPFIGAITMSGQTLYLMDNRQLSTNLLRADRVLHVQNFSGTNFLPFIVAWSSYASFMERLGSTTFSRGIFL